MFKNRSNKANNYQRLRRWKKDKSCVCERCSDKVSGSNLHIHHRDHNHENDGPSNFEYLCKSCHTSHHMRHKVVSEEARRKIGEANKGNKPTKEVRKKLSEANKGKTPWNKGLKTGPRSDETKLKISNTHKRKHNDI